MNLKFLGRGAALYPIEGSTSAYFFDHDDLFLIDCGESTFLSLLNKDILSKCNNVYLLLTHLHSDHTGSIGSLSSYLEYVLQKDLNIIIQKDIEYLDDLKNLMKAFACDNINYIDAEKLDSKYSSFSKLRFHKTIHSPKLSAYSIFFITPSGIVYYSGDTNELDTLQKLLQTRNDIFKIYMDVSSKPNKVHVYIEDLKKVVPVYMHSKIYCMHFDSSDGIEKALTFGFNVVKVD